MNMWDLLEPYFNGPVYKRKYEATLETLVHCNQRAGELQLELEDAKEVIRQLELLVPRPTPPKVDLIAQKDTVFIQQVLNKMNLGIVRLPLDQTYYLTNQSNFLNIIAWDWTDRIDYLKEKFDCENFAILFKAVVDLYFNLNQVAIIIDYKSGHGYNLVIYPDGNASVLEPQSDGLYVWTKRCQTFYSLEGAIALI